MDLRGAHMAQSNANPEALSSSESIAGGSFQSYLSTTNSQQRLRATASYIPLAKEPTPLTIALPTFHQSFSAFLGRSIFPVTGLLLPGNNRHLHTRCWSNACLKWAAITYCCLSVIIFSVNFYKHTTRVEGHQHGINELPDLSNIFVTSLMRNRHSWVHTCRLLKFFFFRRSLDQATTIEDFLLQALNKLSWTFCNSQH